MLFLKTYVHGAYGNAQFVLKVDMANACIFMIICYTFTKATRQKALITILLQRVACFINTISYSSISYTTILVSIDVFFSGPSGASSLFHHVSDFV